MSVGSEGVFVQVSAECRAEACLEGLVQLGGEFTLMDGYFKRKLLSAGSKSRKGRREGDRR